MFRTLLVTVLLLGAVAVANAQMKVTATPVPADLLRGGLTPQMAPDYSNTTNSTNYYYPGGAGAIVADDVHRTSSLPIGQVTFAYYAPTDAPDVTLYIYENIGDFTLPAPAHRFVRAGHAERLRRVDLHHHVTGSSHRTGGPVDWLLVQRRRCRVTYL